MQPIICLDGDGLLYRDQWDQKLGRVETRLGLHAGLEELKNAGLKLVLTTSSDQEWAYSNCKKYEIAPYLDYLFTKEHGIVHEPFSGSRGKIYGKIANYYSYPQQITPHVMACVGNMWADMPADLGMILFYSDNFNLPFTEISRTIIQTYTHSSFMHGFEIGNLLFPDVYKTTEASNDIRGSFNLRYVEI